VAVLVESKGEAGSLSDRETAEGFAGGGVEGVATLDRTNTKAESIDTENEGYVRFGITDSWMNSEPH
jgi:hypothetical protein